jgi:hypothetical protein
MVIKVLQPFDVHSPIKFLVWILGSSCSLPGSFLPVWMEISYPTIGSHSNLPGDARKGAVLLVRNLGEGHCCIGSAIGQDCIVSPFAFPDGDKPSSKPHPRGKRARVGLDVIGRGWTALKSMPAQNGEV